MAEEKELLTILSKIEYEKVLVRLTEEFGDPKIVKRLSLQCTDYSRVDIDTRIRITNGEAELMQKVGDWKNITKGKARTEISVVLPSDVNTIARLYKIIRNLVNGASVENIIMQFENLVWKTKDFEFKLTHQFGKGDGYNCEVEVFDHSLSPKEMVLKYSVPIHLPTQTQDFWRKWNERVNLDANKLSDKELLDIISKYFK